MRYVSLWLGLAIAAVAIAVAFAMDPVRARKKSRELWRMINEIEERIAEQRKEQR